MTVATRTGTALEAAVESFRHVRRTELSEQTLDRVYVPRLNAFAACEAAPRQAVYAPIQRKPQPLRPRSEGLFRARARLR